MFISFLFDQTGCFLAGGRARVKLQKVKGMWNGFDFYYFHLDRIYRIVRNFFACGQGPFGRRPHYPHDPVNPDLSDFYIRAPCTGGDKPRRYFLA